MTFTLARAVVSVAVVMAVLPLAIGEIYSLTVLANAHRATGDPRIAFASIVWAIASLITAGVMPDVRPRGVEVKPEDEPEC